jgi:hypothetical protein
LPKNACAASPKPSDAERAAAAQFGFDSRSIRKIFCFGELALQMDGDQQISSNLRPERLARIQPKKFFANCWVSVDAP